MVVGAEGENLGVMPTDIAIKRAEEAGLDLVEVAPEARPPVCKILDFGKYKYLQKKKQAEAKRNQTTQDLKEVKLRPKTDDHDYDFKLKHCRRFLEAGDKVKVTVMFRGREVIHKDIAIKRLKGIAAEVADLAKVEVMPKMEGRTMHMIIAPTASFLAKKASQERTKKAGEETSEKTKTPAKGGGDAKTAAAKGTESSEASESSATAAAAPEASASAETN